jgi:hypothetical protein
LIWSFELKMAEVEWGRGSWDGMPTGMRPWVHNPIPPPTPSKAPVLLPTFHRRPASAWYLRCLQCRRNFTSMSKGGMAGCCQ